MGTRLTKDDYEQAIAAAVWDLHDAVDYVLGHKSNTIWQRRAVEPLYEPEHTALYKMAERSHKAGHLSATKNVKQVLRRNMVRRSNHDPVSVEVIHYYLTGLERWEFLAWVEREGYALPEAIRALVPNRSEPPAKVVPIDPKVDTRIHHWCDADGRFYLRVKTRGVLRECIWPPDKKRGGIAKGAKFMMMLCESGRVTVGQVVKELYPARFKKIQNADDARRFQERFQSAFVDKVHRKLIKNGIVEEIITFPSGTGDVQEWVKGEFVLNVAAVEQRGGEGAKAQGA